MTQSTGAPPKSRPTIFHVSNLFSRFRWTMALPTQAEPLRFLSAPNGYGKSTMLQMMDDIAHERWGNLTRTLFESATLVFDDDILLKISRFTGPDSVNHIKIVLKQPGADDIEDEVHPSATEAAELPDLPPWIRQLGPDRFRDTRYSETLSREELIAQLGPTLDSRRDKPEIKDSIRSVLKHLHVYYLNANRLSVGIRSDQRRFGRASRRDKDRRPAIEHVSDAVEELLQTTRWKSGRASEQAEASFPSRIIQALRESSSADHARHSSLAVRYAKIREQEESLRSLALTDGVMDAIPAGDLEDKGPVAVVLDEMMAGIERRFAILGQAARRLTLFRDTINGMFEDKQLRFRHREVWSRHSRGGLEVVDSGGAVVPLTALSSGEQQLIVMFGHVLFMSMLGPGGLVLLDEPEISLHPEWQMAVAQSLKKIAEVNEWRMLLATHSPTMIGDDWNDEIALTRTQEG